MNDSNNYPYEFSVVMAVYNVEKYLREAVDSLISQSFGFQKIQLILVDDGSTDSSGKICDEYQRNHPHNIMVIHKDNGGVACARNDGLKYATGRFLNFMDSDDKMSRETFREVYSFFREHEEETDIATVPIELFGAEHGPHWQNWKFEQGSRVINLRDEYQTTDMSCAASFFTARMKDKIAFDSHLVVSEDTKVILTVLIDKMSLGVISKGKYYYRKRDTGTESLVRSANRKKEWYFDYFTYFVDWAWDYYEKILGSVPGFVQYELLCDLQWRICEKKDISVLNEREQREYRERLYKSLERFEDRYILEQKYLEGFQKCFLLQKKYASSAWIEYKTGDICLFVKDVELEPISQHPVKLEFLTIEHNRLKIEGWVSLYGIDIDKHSVFISIQAGDQEIPCCSHRREMDDGFVFHEIAQWAIAFEGEIDFSDIRLEKIGVILIVDKTKISMTNIQYGEFTPISKYQRSYYHKDRLLLRPGKNGFRVEKWQAWKSPVLEAGFLKELWVKNTIGSRKAIPVRIAYHILQCFKRKRIWLISDRTLRAGDNGEAFFRYVRKEQHPSDIRCYFLLHHESFDRKRLELLGPVIDMLSMKHKLLYLLSDWNISSHADPANAHPFLGHSEGYRDLLADKRFVFLQHGVTKDDLSGWLAKSRMNIFGFVTAANAEHRSVLEGSYGYRADQVWLTGFPRFDYLPEEHHQKRLITVMPTWRSYLFQDMDLETGEWVVSDKFYNSCFLHFYHDLLNHPRLLDAVQRFRYKLAFFPHPNFQNYLSDFKINNTVSLLGKEQSYHEVYEKSSLLVTDYSSAVFDFVYIGKPILYCQFDKDEFFTGEHVYRKGYFDYERDGFGEVEYNLEATVDRIIEYMENGCRMKEQYKERVDRFFAYHDRNNCRRVYEKILQMQD